MKSERLKKLEAELNDLDQWMKLGLVPKKELVRHKEEIVLLKNKIEEEKERLRFLKESGDQEEYASPRRGAPKAAYPDMPSMSDVELGEETQEMGFDLETESMDLETSEEETTEEAFEEEKEGRGSEKEEEVSEEEDEDPFSDRNRWRRGGIIDPDANEW